MLNYGYDSDCRVQQKHEKFIVTFLGEMEFLLLLYVEVVDICVVEYGKGSGGGRRHGKVIARLATLKLFVI